MQLTYTKMWNKSGQIDVSWCKQVQLLQTRYGFSLDDRVWMILHHSAADETREARGRHCTHVAWNIHQTANIILLLDIKVKKDPTKVTLQY